MTGGRSRRREVRGGTCAQPFSVYARLADDLAAAPHADNAERDATVAHVLATCAAYAYSDVDTVVTMMTRLGLEANACVRITQTVDAMFIFSTAYLVRGRFRARFWRFSRPTGAAHPIRTRLLNMDRTNTCPRCDRAGV